MGAPVCGFAVRKSFDGEKDFDQTYKEIHLLKKLVPVGEKNDEGEYLDYLEEITEEIIETPIKDVIAAQDDSCGLEAYLRPYRMAGQLPPDVEIDPSKINDFTQFDEVGDLRVSGAVEKLFSSLPEDLQAEYGSPEKLLREVNDSIIESYAKKIIESRTKKPEEKVEEEK